MLNSLPFHVFSFEQSGVVALVLEFKITPLNATMNLFHYPCVTGYNCGEATNIATPRWLQVAKEAAIRRASTNCGPMVSHYQLLYELALSLRPRCACNIYDLHRYCYKTF